MPENISSLQNPRIKNLVRLHDRTHRRRQRAFLIEGLREVERALVRSWPIEALFFCETLFRREESYLVIEQAEAIGIEMVHVSEEAFRKCSHREGPDGMLALASQKSWQLHELPLSANPFLLIVEGIEKPGNLGAIFRTANAAGVDAVILLAAITDPFNPNAVRASQGALFDLPFCMADFDDVATFLELHDIRPCVLTPDASSILWEQDLSQPIALVFGAEDTGVSRSWLSAPSSCVRIPMQGVTDSLNVSATVAVAIFECLRQRHLAR